MPQINKSYGLSNPLQDTFPSPIVAKRSPGGDDINYELGQVWVNKISNQIYALASVSNGQAIWSILGPGSSDVDTLTGDSGGALSPTLGNLNILGGDGLSVDGSGSTLTINRDVKGGYPITPYVVGPLGQAGYQTIQSALDAANGDGGGTVYIQPGTYTENLTLFDQIYLLSSPYGDSSPVIINGTHTPPLSGWITARGIRFNDATAIFSSASNGSANISTEDCIFAVINGHTFNLPNWTGTINSNNCGSAGTNDGFFNNSAGANIFTNNGQFGAGSTQTFTANGNTRFDLSFINCPIAVSGGTIFYNLADFSGTLTLTGDAAGQIFLGNFFTGSDVAIDHQSSGNINLNNTSISTSNNPAISGTGPLNLSGVFFQNNANLSSSLSLTSNSTIVNDGISTVISSSGLVLRNTNIDAEGTDANISINLSPKGTGNFTVNGETELTGNLVLSASGTHLQVQGGAATDFIGQATLVAGTVTIANTNISASDKVFLSREGVGGSTALGLLDVSITPSTSFTINSLQSNSPASLETNDVSIVNYLITREV